MRQFFAFFIFLAFFCINANSQSNSQPDSVHIIVEQPPIPIIGMAAMYKIIYEELKVPSNQTLFNSKLKVKFIVRKNGAISDIMIENEDGKSFEEQLFRIFQKVGKWKSAIHNGQNVSVYYSIPVHICLKE